MESINWDELELVIFDVDGTLYDQKKLRNNMMLALFFHYCIRPWRYKDLLILYHFRKEREKRHGYQSDNLQTEQYLWVLPKVNVSLYRIKKVVDYWIFSYPNKLLNACVYPGLKQFLAELKKNNIRTAIYSDYESEQKLRNMNITVDLIVSSTDVNINAFKPNPIGLNYIIAKLKIKNSNCLFIGDRNELDGECALRAEIPFFLINDDNTNKQPFKVLYDQLLNH
ncbi:HAD family hydrolase [Pedobacter sp. ASV1-7]|uniref:HAD family hydrolase n=1 Tax=Pedobacter sp. ASV1-7 TaxID=3145237 RepID=UPI0032E8E62B